MMDLDFSYPKGFISAFPDLVLISIGKFLCIFFLSTLMFLPFVISPLNNLCLGKCSCVAPWYACRKRQLLPTGKWVCWSLLQNGWLCYCAVFCSACISQKSQGDGRGLSGFFVPFTCHCRVILFVCLLWSHNSFGRKEKKWLSLQSTKQLLGALSLTSLLLHLTELGKGKAGDALCAEGSISHLTGKSNNSLKVPIPDTPPVPARV